MTKYEYLRESSLTENIYTWKTLGANKIESTTKIYNTDMIYLVDVKGSPLNNYLIYCKKEFIGGIKWTQGKLYDYNFGEISFGNDIVSPCFYVLLTEEEYLSVDQTSEEFIKGYKKFQPYKNINSTGKVIISDEDYKRCLIPLGGTFITEEELEYSRDEICDLAIKPALEEYFHWIPSIIETSVDVQTDGQEIDMPSEAYTVVGLSLQQYGSSTSGNILSPLFYGMEQALYSGYNYTSLTGSYTGNKARTQLNSMSSLLNSRASAQALINYTRRVHYEGPYKRADGSQYIKVYSNTQGTFDVWWGKQTLDFNDVEYANRTRVFEYAQACVKELFGSLRGQVKSDIPGLIDYSQWIKDADAKKKEIRDEWKKMVKASGVIRGSL